VISAAILALVLSGPPVVLIDSTSGDKGAAVAIAAGLDPILCMTFEKSFKNAKIASKCRSDVEAILRLRAMQSAVGSPGGCNANPEKCAAQMAKMVHCTHVVVASVTPVKKSFKLTLQLVDIVGKPFASTEVEGADLNALVAALPKAVQKISAGISKP
jgi:hypothetical protein